MQGNLIDEAETESLFHEIRTKFISLYLVGCGDPTHRCRRRRHRTQAGTKRIKQHKRNNKIFSDACASKGRRGRRPLQGRCVQCNHTDNARAQRKHSSHFLKFSAIHCRVRRLDAPLPPSAAQNASSEQSELNSMNRESPPLPPISDFPILD